MIYYYKCYNMIYADKTRILSGMHLQGVLFWMITSHHPPNDGMGQWWRDIPKIRADMYHDLPLFQY